MNFFADGSLRNKIILKRVLGKDYKSERGNMRGWRLLKVKGKEYPGLVKSDGIVPGTIWMDLSKEDFEKLDSFEGNEYERITWVAASTINLNKYDVEVYQYKDSMKHKLLDEEWIYDDFEKKGIR